MPSFYCPQLDEKSKIVSIEDTEFKHIAKVFRHKIGDGINLNSGKGFYASAEIIELDKNKLVCQIKAFVPKEKYEPAIAVAFSLLRNKNDFLLVEKLTELGVAELFPFESDYSVRKASKNTKEKFVTTAIGAIKQCDNAHLPIVNDSIRLSQVIENVITKGYIPVIASELENDKTIIDVVNEAKGKAICIFIGPEGGFSKGEFDLFKQKEFIQFKLGINILRAETAAICAVSQVISSYL